jgi:TolA-binding protein
VRPPSPSCRDDLFARSRRGPLSAVEQRALQAHLGVCQLCQAARAFAVLYDSVPDRPEAEDDALVARLAHRIADRGVAGARGRRPLGIAFAAAVALLVVAGGAAAWVSVRGPSPAGERATPAVRSAPPATGAKALSLAPPREESPVEVLPPTAPPLPGAAPAVTAPAPRRRARAEPARTPSAEPTAAELFAAANTARRARDLRGAIDRYLALERRFPDSEESIVSLVSAADLLARLGESDGALRTFDRYLARRPEGSLAPEALFGRARALKQLGRRADETDAWRRLLLTFPGSIYEPAARKRLDELSR